LATDGQDENGLRRKMDKKGKGCNFGSEIFFVRVYPISLSWAGSPRENMLIKGLSYMAFAGV